MQRQINVSYHNKIEYGGQEGFNACRRMRAEDYRERSRLRIAERVKPSQLYASPLLLFLCFLCDVVVAVDTQHFLFLTVTFYAPF